jgi:hypothetical protein
MRTPTRIVAISLAVLVTVGVVAVATQAPAPAHHGSKEDCTGPANLCFPDGFVAFNFTPTGASCLWTRTISWGDGVTDTQTSSTPYTFTHQYTSHGFFTLTWTATGTPIEADYCIPGSGTFRIEVPRPIPPTPTTTPTDRPTPSVTPTPTPTRPPQRLRCFGERVTIRGTNGDDRLSGTGGADVIDGRGGDDTIDGKGGNDLICGGGGADEIDGGKGADGLRGEGGDDAIGGGRGDDRLSGGSGTDTCDGGAGGDIHLGGCETYEDPDGRSAVGTQTVGPLRAG